MMIGLTLKSELNLEDHLFYSHVESSPTTDKYSSEDFNSLSFLLKYNTDYYYY